MGTGDPPGVVRAPLPADFYRQHWGAMPPPKFSTPRDFTAPTTGAEQAAFAKLVLCQPFMPFQRYVADVAGELRRNAPAHQPCCQAIISA